MYWVHSFRWTISRSVIDTKESDGIGDPMEKIAINLIAIIPIPESVKC